MRTRLFFWGVCILIVSLYFYSCSSRRTKTDMALSESRRQTLLAGRLIFKSKCQKCHPDGEGGVGTPINAIHLPKALLKARVRSRAFLFYTGRMPAFDKHEISKQELKDLLVYVKEIEKTSHEN